MNKFYFFHPFEIFFVTDTLFQNLLSEPYCCNIIFFSQILWLVQYFVKIFCILHKDRTSLVYFDLFSINSSFYFPMLFGVFFSAKLFSSSLYVLFSFIIWRGFLSLPKFIKYKHKKNLIGYCGKIGSLVQKWQSVFVHFRTYRREVVLSWPILYNPWNISWAQAQAVLSIFSSGLMSISYTLSFPQLSTKWMIFPSIESCCIFAHFV